MVRIGRYILVLAAILLEAFVFSTSCTSDNSISEERPSSQVDSCSEFAIVIHGGCGNITRENVPEEKWEMYKAGLKTALDNGYEILKEGGAAMEAVQTAIITMENDSLFNAGKGSVFNSIGQQEMDASIMDGKTLNSGAVAGVNRIKNPILAARLVMDSSRHVMLSGSGAVQFAEECGLELVDSSYFFTRKRYEYWKSIKVLEDSSIVFETEDFGLESKKYGTVGAVALDKHGNIVAGTSTGGMTNKKYGRIGDSPVIGAGTYANNKSCGVSCTGTGEYFIRTLAAHEVSNLMLYKGLSAKEATHMVIFDRVGALGGDGGMIVLDRNGCVAWDFNTSGMFRAFKNSQGELVIEAFEQKLEK